ncbi:MAG: hypothetical protein U9N82_04450, partial [Thermodesulfobacteriota bacterium]|nr:hypothetical protein [Thermodesulfobacteriota bacterium]
VGVPDTNVGERVKAIVVLKEDVRGVSGTELTKWCRDRLASYKPRWPLQNAPPVAGSKCPTPLWASNRKTRPRLGEDFQRQNRYNLFFLLP